MVSFVQIMVETGSADGDGRLAYVEGKLVAVLVRLSQEHANAEGQWFLEAGFGALAYPRPPAFANLEEAAVWITAQRRTDLGA